MNKVSAFIFLLLFFVSCQKAQLAEYRKYANDADVPRISAEDAKKEVDAGNAVIVDSRGDSVFKIEHIAGAINIPFGAPKEKFSDLPKGKKIIVYCS